MEYKLPNYIDDESYEVKLELVKIPKFMNFDKSTNTFTVLKGTTLLQNVNIYTV